MKGVYLDYPSTEWGDKLDNFYTILTYISILTVIFGSFWGPGDHYFYVILILEFVYSMLFLTDFIARMVLSKFSYKFFLNPLTIADILSFLPIMLIIFFNIGWDVHLLTIFRLSRILRLLKIKKHMKFMKILRNSLCNNLYKYQIIFTFFALAWLISSFLMYGFENTTNPTFQNIPKTMLWFVGYGRDDTTVPITVWGKHLYYISKFFSPIFFSLFTSSTIVVFLETVNFLKGADIKHEAKEEE